MAFTTVPGSGATDATSYIGSQAVDTLLLQNVDNAFVGMQAANDTLNILNFKQAVSNYTVKGGAGNDAIDFSNGGAGTANLTGGLINGNKNVDTITITTATSATVYGGQGTDNINVTGRLVSSIANGNKDTDTVTTAGASGSSIFGGQGSDTLNLNGTTTASVVQGDLDVDTINAAGTISGSTVNGNGGADVINITATSTNTTYYGGSGADTVTAANATSGATISGDLGADSVTGSSFADVVTGGDGADSVASGAGADSVDGGAGVDTIAGGTAADTLTGGAELDSFRFANNDSSFTIGGTGNAGTITGFDNVTDFALGSATSNSETVDGTSQAYAVGAIATAVDSTLTVGGQVVDTSNATVTNGVVVFDDALGAVITVSDVSRVAAVTQALNVSDIGGAGSSLAFTGTLGGVATSWLYTQTGATAGGNLIQFDGITATSIAATNANTAGLMFLA